MNRLKAPYSLISNYKSGILSLWISFIVILCLLTILLTIKDYFSYYASVSYGFIPDIAVFFQQDMEEKQLKDMINGLEKKFQISHIRTGLIRKISNAYFLMKNDQYNITQTLKQNIHIIGIVLNANKDITVFQDGHQYVSTVADMDEFGSWFIKIKKVKGLKPGKCAIVTHTNVHIPVDIFGEKDRFNLRFACDDTKIQQAFYAFLNHFIGRFTQLDLTGIDIDRFAGAHYQTDEANLFDVYQKRKIVAYANLIFEKSPTKIHALLSHDIMKSFSKYGSITQTTLCFENKQLQLHALDSFNYKPEKKLENSVILINYDVFRKVFKDHSNQKMMFVYSPDYYLDSMVQYIKSWVPDIVYIDKSQSIPSFMNQKMVINVCVHLLSILFFVIVLCIITIRLLKFYSIFYKDLLIMKLYGFKVYLYSILLMIVLILSSVVAYSFLYVNHHFFNKLLLQFYYQPMTFPLMNYGVALLSCGVIFIVAFIIEYRLFHQLSYNTNGVV